MKGSDAFEKSLKEALEHYEVPYNSADWVKLNEELGRPHNGKWQSSAGLYILLFAGSMSVATTMHMLFNEPTTAQGTEASGFLALLDTTTPETSPLPGETIAEAIPALVNNEVDANSETTTPVNTRSTAKRHTAGAMDLKGSTRSTATGVVHAPAPSPAGADNAIRPSVTEGCPGTTVHFKMENLPEDGIHLWNFGDGNFSNKSKPVHTYQKSGTFEVMLSHSSIHGGNFSNRPASDRIVIHEAPEAAFHHIPREYPGMVPSVHFENHSLHGKNFLWDLGDGHTSTAVHPDHVYKKKGNYTVGLTVTNDKGCVDRVERVVHIAKDYDLGATKTFSPNGDGVNDVFIPEALRELGARFQLSIFHAGSGQLVFETADPNRPWNGRVNNKGDQCASGEYVWVVEMSEKHGGTYNGNVSLVR